MRRGYSPVAAAVFVMTFTVALLTSGTAALALGIDRFVLSLPDLRVEIGPSTPLTDHGTRPVTVLAAGMVISSPEEWEAQSTGAETFSIRHREWRALRLDVDCASGSVFPTSGEAGADPSRERPLEGASCAPDADGTKHVLTLPSVSLSCRPADRRLSITLGSRVGAAVLSGPEGWEIEEAGVFLYRLRRREWGRGAFWEVDVARRTATTAAGQRVDLAVSEAGSPRPGVRVEFAPKNAGRGTLARKDPARRKKPAQLSPAIRDVVLKSYEAGVPVLRSDADAPDGKPRPPASRWREKVKEVFGRALGAESCDVLVVPFQVEGWAVDRIERALMTRYLSDAVAQATGLRLPNPTLVARALGDGARVIPEAEIYRLANAVRARTLVTGFVGHDRGERMQVTILVRERRGDAPLGEGTEPARHIWKEIPFSDERLPSEAFLGMLDDALARIFPGGTRPPTPAPAAREAALPVPATLGEMVGGGDAGPVQDAFTLQMLGLLVADEGTVAESFFERSLVALRRVAPASPDYRLLKAGAYASLHRRPAALEALGDPASDAEALALEAYLDGDLPALRQRVDGIARPLPRLMARIRLNDLEQRYGTEREARARARRSLAEEHPGLREVLKARLEQGDPWAFPSSVGLKREFDAFFPIAGERLEDLAARARATGEEPSGEDLDRAVFNQYHQALKGELFAPRGSVSPVPGDALDLLFAAQQWAMVKRVGHPILVQGLPEAGLETLALYERTYPDHPDLAYLREAALRGLLGKVGGEAGRQLEEEAASLAQKLFFWSDGQSPAAAKVMRWIAGGPYALPSYDADYPRRPFWPHLSAGDRGSLAGFSASPAAGSLPGHTRHELKNALVSLAYTITDLTILQDLYGKFVDLGLSAEASALLEANRRRFQGHALWPDLLARAEAGDDGARRVYEQAMADDPLKWDPYFELGRIMIGEGDFAGAARMFLSFPLFREPERGNRVDLSHAAYGAASELLFRGATEEAIPILELAAGLGSGSGSEMGALAYLAQLRGDYPGAALLFRDRGNRYRHRGSYGLYVRYLHITGRHEEAESLFASLKPGPETNGLWYDAAVGLRSSGLSDADVEAWFRRSLIGSFPFIAVNDGEPLLMAFLVDRGPNTRLPDFLSAREDAAELYTPWFAEGYRLLKEGRHEDAYRTLLTRLTEPAEESFPAFLYALPALAWAGARSGHADEVSGLLQRYDGILGKDFHYHLALALLQGGNGDAAGAVAQLRKAWYSVDVSYPPIDFSFPWYQLLEAAEWLHADSPRQEYLDLILRWSRICQRMYPTEAWTYAVEALHTTSPADRTRALGLGLFLDRNSQRLSGFPAAERERAQEWLRRRNPFLLPDAARTDSNTF